MLKKIAAFLRQPYPDRQESKFYLKEAAAIGILIFFILFTLQPFSLGNQKIPIFYLSLIYGLISFFVSLFFSFFERYILKIEKDKPEWTYSKWLFSTTILIALIATVNFFATMFLFKGLTFDIMNYFIMLRNTFLIGIFPTMIFGALSLNRRKRENETLATQIHHSQIHISNAKVRILNNKNEVVYENLSDYILYLEAMQNYVSLYYLKDHKKERLIIRNTLKNLAKQVSPFSIIQCHRSFLVNTNLINKIDGNAQGLLLSLNNEKKQIPVSRKYLDTFKNIINK